MYLNALCASLPERENICETTMGRDFYRAYQRVTSPFFPIKYSNRHVISDRHLYRSVSSCIEPGVFDVEKVLGEWVVDYEMRPMSDNVLGRLLKVGEETTRRLCRRFDSQK